MKMKKILSESEKITATLLSKARKPKGVAQWAKLEPLKEKLEGKQQSHIQFTSYNPKAFGKQRTLASKEGALDFLMGYVSPQFFIAPYHLQVINPDLSDNQAREWLLTMGHPSRVPPQGDKATGPEGDIETGFCHDSVADQYPGKQFSLFEVSPSSEEDAEEPEEAQAEAQDDDSEIAEVEPALAETAEGPDTQVGKSTDLLLACPFGGGSRCRQQGGSGSPFHHINSDSMRVHLEKIAVEVGGDVQLPKMGSFKGEPALFFEHKGAPYVAVPTRQEIHAKDGAVYKWSFLSEGPLANANPFLARAMNQMAPRKPVIIPFFDVAEDVVTLAHDCSASEDPLECDFNHDVFQLVKDFFPRPGSVIAMGIVKGDKLYAVVTERSLDFYTEKGVDTYFQASDGKYYAYFDLTGNETPALILLSFINLFLTHIDTTSLEQQIQKDEDASSEAKYGKPTPGFESTPSTAPVWGNGGGVVTVDDPVKTFADLAKSMLKNEAQILDTYDVVMLSKPDNWEAHDLPPYLCWKFSTADESYIIAQTSCDFANGKAKTGLAKPLYLVKNSQGLKVALGNDLLVCLSKIGIETDNILAYTGLAYQSFPAGCTAASVRDGSLSIVPEKSVFAD